jgi:hypothetical protein
MFKKNSTKTHPQRLMPAFYKNKSLPKIKKTSNSLYGYYYTKTGHGRTIKI